MTSPMTVHGKVSKMDTMIARKDSKWTILTDLESGAQYNIKPKVMEGMLTKKRKFPMKGWHKRYFILDNGFLSYGKNASELSRGRTHGKIDVGLALISTKTELFRIDLDDEHSIHHLKASEIETYGLWIEQLQQHRFFRQNQINQNTENKVELSKMSPRDSLNRSLKGNFSLTMQEFLNLDERMTNQLCQLQQSAVNLGLLAQKLEDDPGNTGSSGKSKNWLGLRKKKSNNGGNTISSRSSTLTDQNRSNSPDLAETENDLVAMSALSNSNPSLNSRPSSMNLSSQNKEELIMQLNELHTELGVLVKIYSEDKVKLKNAIENHDNYKGSTLGGSGAGGANMAQVANLKQTLNQVNQQNAHLKAKLQKIHLDSQIDDIPQIPNVMGMNDTLISGLGHQSLYSSEFFDAKSYIYSEYSSDEEDIEEENSSDDEQFEEAQMPSSLSTEFASLENASNLQMETANEVKTSTLTRMTGRRQKLPAMKPDTSGLNLWNLLCKNIGKDLSKISMPVTLNEPLSALQRLCEELEYSDLLDKAAESSNPVERMTLVAAFAVSAYGYVTARAGHKPFNPLLGETYECIRDDKGFKYIAEQVSHHPPVSACHAVGKNWTWWQDLRIRTKFWGKSMEFQPDALVNLKLVLNNGDEEFYSWNKITTCIHNLFSSGSDRWADLYGECQIKCKESTLTCKLEFLKASGYWTSGKRHEVVGTVTDNKGKVQQHLFGICTEALYCGQAPSTRCIWRPGALPNDCELFYGFSRFAIELNEILESERSHLPKTDTRFRPDQRALEEGRISEAESLKLKLEQAQRDRRLQMEKELKEHFPAFFSKAQNKWNFNQDYWVQRNNGKFGNLLDLW